VTLSGSVPTAAQRLIAVEIAGGTDNVRAVNDLLSSTLPD
jgi:osmotically-inducible protein OsmY